MEKLKEKIQTVNKKEKTKLRILKRRIPIKRTFLRGEEAKKFVQKYNHLLYFYRFHETRIEIKRGDVFHTSFSFSCGNEITGNHFVVAIVDSSELSQLVTVIPLKSYKGTEINPASDVLIGKIPGLANLKEAIAVINQITTIDKRKLFSEQVICNLNQLERNEKLKDCEETVCQEIISYRLTDEQFKKVHKAGLEYLFNNYIKHKK